MKYLSCLFSFVLIVLLSTAGCSSQKRPDGMPALVPCEVVITQEGKSLADANVSLLPVDTSGKWNASGSTDVAGKAKMFTWSSHEGVAPGKYKVVISKVEIEKLPPRSSDSTEPSRSPQSFNLVEEVYGEADKTPLEIEVVAGKKEYPLEAGKVVRLQIAERH